MQEKHISPDGKLTFLVIRDHGEVSMGFEGVPSHTHGDIEAEIAGLPLDQAVALYVQRLVQNKSLIGIATVDGKIVDIWISEMPPPHDKYKPSNEIVSFRFWNGVPYAP
jgi:hypothetical protein